MVRYLHEHSRSRPLHSNGWLSTVCAPTIPKRHAAIAATTGDRSARADAISRGEGREVNEYLSSTLILIHKQKSKKSGFFFPRTLHTEGFDTTGERRGVISGYFVIVFQNPRMDSIRAWTVIADLLFSSPLSFRSATKDSPPCVGHDQMKSQIL